MTGRLNSLQALGVAYYLHPFTNLSAHEKEGPHIITRGDPPSLKLLFAKGEPACR